MGVVSWVSTIAGAGSGRRAGWPVNGSGKRPGGVHARVGCGRGMSEQDLPWAGWRGGAGSGPGRADPGPEGEEPAFSVPVLGLSSCPRSKFQRKRNGKLLCKPLGSPSFPHLPPVSFLLSLPPLPFYVESLEHAPRIYSSPRFLQKSSFPTLPCIQHPFWAAVGHFANSFQALSPAATLMANRVNLPKSGGWPQGLCLV